MKTGFSILRKDLFVGVSHFGGVLPSIETKPFNYHVNDMITSGDIVTITTADYQYLNNFETTTFGQALDLCLKFGDIFPSLPRS